VVLSVLAVGIATLGFQVSIPQILTSMVTAFVIEGAWTFWRTGKLVYPASALNTATGIALIVRIVGVGAGDYWSWQGWHVYALVVALALATKYFVRYRGDHVFNPSNLALVVAFVVLGSGRVEPLDLWWAPTRGWMIVAYLIIIAGGTVTLSGLKMMFIPAVFWLSLALGLGVLAGSGHCITARWSVQPVCGGSFWWVVMTSPELLFFLFFMITDPKTIPRGRNARVLFTVVIGILVALLAAPQTTEFGTKVGLLAALTVMSPFRWLIDARFPKTSDARSGIGQLVSRAMSKRGTALGPTRTFLRGAFGGAAVAAIGILIVVSGAPARQVAEATATAADIPVAVQVDPAMLPEVSVDPDVDTLNSDVGDPRALAVALAENLEIEAEAMRRHEGMLLLSADFGKRLTSMQEQMARSVATGEWIVSRYDCDSLHLTTVTVEGGQGTDLAFAATGTVEETTYDADGVELRSEATPFSTVFVLRLTPGERWLIFDQLDPEAVAS
jgi:hypothetical protein